MRHSWEVRLLSLWAWMVLSSYALLTVSAVTALPWRLIVQALAWLDAAMFLGLLYWMERQQR